jgi:hypothetical protein
MVSPDKGVKTLLFRGFTLTDRNLACYNLRLIFNWARFCVLRFKLGLVSLGGIKFA